jgi:hypothetical protein
MDSLDREKKIHGAIRKGVAFLVRVQNRDGSWGSARNTKSFNIWAPVPGSHHAFRGAVSALCVMALLENAGDDEEAQAALRRGADFLSEKLGRIKRAGSVTMYNVWAHAFGLHALCELMEREVDPERRARIRKAAEDQLEHLLRYETTYGGWGYYDYVGTRRPAASPTSFTTATGLIALHAARRAGLRVPPATIRKAVRVLTEIRKPDGSYMYGRTSRFYPLFSPNRMKGSLGRSQPCDLALRLFGGEIYDRDMERSLDRLFRWHHFIDIGRKRPWPHEAWYSTSGYYFFYGHYYAALCVEQLRPETQPKYQAQLATILLRLQEPDGSWWDYPLYDYHKQYGTAMALMALGRCHSSR